MEADYNKRGGEAENRIRVSGIRFPKEQCSANSLIRKLILFSSSTSYGKSERTKCSNLKKVCGVVILIYSKNNNFC